MPGRKAGGRTGPRIHPVYGYRSCHTGDDIGAPSGTPIKAAADGVVISIASGGPYGNHTLISHGGGLVTMYAHQSRFGVTQGQQVSRGQTIGYVGSTGYSTDPICISRCTSTGSRGNPWGGLASRSTGSPARKVCAWHARRGAN